MATINGGVPPTVTVAGRVFTDLTNLKILNGAFSTTNTNCSARTDNGSSGYTPSGSKKFRVLAWRTRIIASQSGQYIRLGYSDNDVGFPSATAFTNPVYTSSGAIAALGDTQAAGSQEGLCNFLVPNGKYVAVNSLGTSPVGNVELFGYEED